MPVRARSVSYGYIAPVCSFVGFVILISASSSVQGQNASKLFGKTLLAELELTVKKTSPVLFIIPKTEEATLPFSLKLRFDRSHVYYFNVPDENGNQDTGEMLPLNGEIDLAANQDRLDPRVTTNFYVSKMNYRTAIEGETLTISGELIFHGKNSGEILNQSETWEVEFSQNFSLCSVQSYSQQRSVLGLEPSAQSVSLLRENSCLIQ
jgi:hypothetical protein